MFDVKECTNINGGKKQLIELKNCVDLNSIICYNLSIFNLWGVLNDVFNKFYYGE